MGIKSKIFIIFLTGTVLYCGYYFAIPVFLNRPGNVEFLQKYIQKEYGFETSIRNPKIKMGYLPAVWIRADEFKILNNDKSDALAIQGVKTRVKLLPLIFSKAEISHFSADNLQINLIFDKNSQLKLGQYPLLSISDPKITVNKAVVDLASYGISLKDEIVNKNIIVTGKDFEVYDFTNNKRIRFKTNSKLSIGNKISKIFADVDVKLPLTKISEDQIVINGKIEDLNLADFSTYAKYLSKNEIERLSGIVNLDVETVLDKNNHKQINGSLAIENLGLMQKDINNSIYSNDTLKINTNLSLIQNGFVINELTLKSKGIDTFLSGKISKIDTKKPKVNLKLSINPSRIENFLPLLPGDKNFQNSFNLYLLKKYKYYGDIIGNLEIKGDYLEPSITGNILSTNGYLEKPIPNNTPKATIKLQFRGDKTALDAHVPASQSQIVFVKGLIKLYEDKAADLNITSTQNVDLKTAQIVLNPLHQILKFDLGPVPIMDIKGKGNINLHVVGTTKDPHAWGVFNFDNTTASFLDIHNMELKNGKGSLSFDNQSTHFVTEKADLNGKPVSVDGTCTLLGELNFKVASLNQNSGDLLKIIQTSPMLKDIQSLLSPIKSADGLISVNLNLTGQIKDIYDVVFNKNIFANGKLELNNNKVTIENLPLQLRNLSGSVNFRNLDADFNISSNLDSSKIRTNGRIKDMILNTNIYSDRFTLADAARMAAPQNKKIPFLKDLATISTSFSASYKGAIDKINYNALQVKGKVYPNRGSKSIIITDGGSFTLENSKFSLSPIKGTFNKNPYILTADVSHILSPKQDINGYFSMSKFNLENLSSLKGLDIFPKDFNPDDFKEMKGILDLTARMRHNNLSFFTKLDDTEFVYAPKHLKVKFNSGNILLRNNTLALNKINAYAGEMPLFIDGKIYNLYKNPDLSLYINAKPTQEFFDQFFNNKAVYPIKLKGDVNLASKITGTKDRLAAKTDVKIEENSNLYYMGATIGDVNNPVKLYLDNIYTPKGVKINSFKYDKIIASQNNKNFTNTQLTSSGSVEFLPNNNLSFSNLRVKTENPTDAKIFNIIFRKPFMKQGIFTSDLLINGTTLKPKILGKLDITSIDIPFVDLTVNDVNLDFKPDKIFITSKGVLLTNRVNISAVMKNNLTTPYIIENIKLKLNDLNINKFTEAIRDFEADIYRSKTQTANAENYDLSQLVIKNAEIEAETVKVKNISAEDFKANLNLNEKMLLDVKNFEFKLAEGLVNGSIKYDFLTNRANLLMHMKDSNAQIISEALFDLHNQIYGSITGDVDLSCNAQSNDTCMSTLDGNGYFIVKQGRMPKLGSLEYLLKAGNLLKGGITGLSINSIIDLITPLKTGEFDSISGNMNIEDGIAQNINIYSNGKNLNMYLKGSYNFSNSMADMNVYGTLSNNITSVFGKVKNASLNTLLNTIPLVNKNELDPKTMAEINKIPNMDSQNIYRIFNAEIFGDINGNNYVRTFKWIK